MFSLILCHHNPHLSITIVYYSMTIRKYSFNMLYYYNNNLLKYLNISLWHYIVHKFVRHSFIKVTKSNSETSYFT
jgi:hypothetical protein